MQSGVDLRLARCSLCPVLPAAALISIGSLCSRPGIGCPRQEQKALHKVSVVSSFVVSERGRQESHADTHIATAKLLPM